MRVSLRRKLILTHIALLVIVVILADVITTLELQRYYKARILAQLRTQLDQIEYLLQKTELSEIDTQSDYNRLVGYAQAAQLRITLIDSTGALIFDSNVPRDSLTQTENHLRRPEVQQAIHHRLGANERLSATVHQRMLYVARKVGVGMRSTGQLEKAAFVRLAIPLIEVENALADVQQKILIGGGIALLMISLASFWVSSKLTSPIKSLASVAESVKHGNLTAHFEHHAKDELGEFADLLNEMLAKLRDDLQKMHKLEMIRTQFLGNVSHELRTPIFALQGYLETLMQGRTMSEQVQKEFVEKAYRQANRLNNLLTDLIDISRIESGEMKMSFRYFDIHDWLAKQTTDLQPIAKVHDVTLQFVNAGTSNAITIMGDSDRLKQVITNLAENALKYNVSAGRVEIGYKVLNNEVEIFVSDTGRGIPPEHVSRIFERFYRVDKERSRLVGGTGLGLAIVKHIVEAHGSKVNVVSEPGVGSTFSFRLKRK